MGTEAMDLLKPDVSPRRVKENEDDDDLEALRLAALRSMKPRKPQGYQLQPHPRRTNLVTIVVDEEPPISSAPPRQDKFSRYKDDERSSSDDDEEEEVLKLDASAEVDELTQLLDDLEDKVLKDPKSSHSKRSPPRRSPSPRRRRRSPPIKNGKSKSLPPSSSSSSSKRRIEEPRLPTPEREKRLARKKKFQAPLNDKKKVISLRNIKECSLSPPPPSTPLEDAISLSVEDTLDMFDEEDAAQRSLKRKQVSLSANTSPSSHKGGVMDLRVQLHKKRQQKRGLNKSHTGGPSTYIEEQRMVSMGEEDTLENAVLESSSEEEESYSHSKKPRRVLIREMTTKTIPSTNESSSSANKRKTNRPSIMSRLGEPVTEANKRRSPSPEATLGKSPKKKKEKKEKRKKSKKDKKEKKRGGGSKSSGKSRVSSSGEDDAHHPSDDDEELFKFFEEEEGSGETSQQDELMKRMEKINQARLKRLKEIEEDKMLHT